LDYGPEFFIINLVYGGIIMNYEDVSSERSYSSPLSRVFGWMGLALAITATVAYGVYWFLNAGLLSPEVYMVLMIGSVVFYFVLLIVINVRVLRNRKSALVPYLLYATTMGILLSTLMFSFTIETIGLAFGVSALVFGMMAAYGAVTKQNLNVMASIAFMMLFGSIILSLINLFFFNESIYWITSFAIFGAILLITAWDVWRLQRQIEMGDLTRNMAIFFALQLYVDFINIFLRVLYYLSYRRR
jgi:FtsH-binding integral membrane protein